MPAITKDEQTLESCPFCGGAAHYSRYDTFGCLPCGIWMVKGREAEWNRRAATEHITDTAATQAAPPWKVCGVCMGRGLRDVAHGVTKPCPDCDGKGCVRNPAAPDLAPTDLSAVEVPPLPERDGDWAGDDWYTKDTMTNFYREGYAAGRASMKVNK